MEPARSTDDFSRRITVSDANNIITVLDLFAVNSEYQIFDEDYKVTFQCALEDVKCTVGLFSLAPAPFPKKNILSEAGTQAEIAKIQSEGQKIGLSFWTAKGNGPWIYKCLVVLQNQDGNENHVPVLVPHLGSNETLLVGGNFKLGVKIEPIWNQPLKAIDYIVVGGTYKQIVTFSKKKDDGLEALNARIGSLELALYGRLTDLPANSLVGRNAGAGPAETISQDIFARRANPTVSGLLTTEGQIAFPAAQTPSTNPNILDDYEEGVYTPTLSYTTPGTSSFSYSRNSGRYCKVGNRVEVSFDIRITAFSKGSASGYFIVAGLPFTPRNGGGFDNNIGWLFVGNAPFTGIPSLQTSALFSTLNVLFLFKLVSNAVNTPLDDPVAGAIYFGQISYESIN